MSKKKQNNKLQEQTEYGGYDRVAEILEHWNKGDFDHKDTALELFSLPQRDLVDYIIISQNLKNIAP